MEQAGRIDAMAAKGDPLPPLAGVPIGIKDVMVMKGAPATAGSKILEGYHPPYDSTAVARLEAAGAVLLGEMNCDEFAMGSSNENSAYGPVRNPVDLERVPGGSSGGSAAAVAANLAVATLGSDTGGSVSPAGELLRCGGGDAHRGGFALRADCVCVLAGPHRAVCGKRARCGDDSERDCRPRRQGRHQLGGAGRGLRRGKRQARRGATDRRTQGVLRRGARRASPRRDRKRDRGA